MLGYDISWAGFNIIEVMSSPKFTHKRIGYLAASQCFHADSEVSLFLSCLNAIVQRTKTPTNLFVCILFELILFVFLFVDWQFSF